MIGPDCSATISVLDERTAAGILEELRPHMVRSPIGTHVVDVPVGDHQIEIAVEIAVDKLCSKRQQIEARLLQRVFPGGVRK